MLLTALEQKYNMKLRNERYVISLLLYSSETYL